MRSVASYLINNFYKNIKKSTLYKNIINISVLIISPFTIKLSEIINMQDNKDIEAITGKFRSIKTVAVASTLISFLIYFSFIFKDFNAIYAIVDNISNKIFENKGSLDEHIGKTVIIWIAPQIAIHVISLTSTIHNNISRYIINFCGGNAIHVPMFYWTFLLTSKLVLFITLIFMLGFLPYFIEKDIINGAVENHYLFYGLAIIALYIISQKEKISNIRKVEIYGSKKACIYVSVVTIIIISISLSAVIYFIHNYEK